MSDCLVNTHLMECENSENKRPSRVYFRLVRHVHQKFEYRADLSSNIRRGFAQACSLVVARLAAPYCSMDKMNANQAQRWRPRRGTFAS